MGLTAAEIEHFREQGYVIPDFRLPDELLGRLRGGLDRLLATYTDVKPEDLANPHMLPPTKGPECNPFMEAARHPAILDRLEQLIGPDIVLWITRVLCKPAAKGREVPWHQDGEYWPMRPLATCSVWIALDPVSTANGCMRFIPGSHKQKELYRHHTTERDNLVLNLELDQDQFDESTAVNVELESGQMSLHDVRLIHGSLANTSGQRRAALIMRYMPATSHYDRALVKQTRTNSPFNLVHQPLWLMRGVDRSGKNDFVDGHAQWEERYAKGLSPALASEG
jgi:ectoine hydroxylase-related dioxygenase (phytanoyl-CoA dioxygenase family)